MRLAGPDIARFIAFTGMVLVNFRIAAQVSGTHDWAFQITHLFEGRAAALFLLAIGLLNQIIFPADILHYYGVYFLCAIPMMRLSPRGLLIASSLILALSFAMLIGLNYEAGWNWITLEYSNFWTPAGFIRNLFYNGWHPVFPWITFLLFGMWLGRLNLANHNTQIKLALAGGTWAAAIVALSATLVTDPELAEVMGLSPIPPGPLFMLAGIGTSTAMIGATLLVTPLLTRLNIAQWLAIPGRQTLTLYVAHILIGMGLLEAMGKLDGSLSSPMIFTIAILFATLTSLYAQLWSRINPRGPLEA